MESEAELSASIDPGTLAACVAELARDYAGARYDSRLIAGCRAQPCAEDALALIEESGARVTSRLSALSLVVVDVGSREAVLPWLCRYRLDPLLARAFLEPFPNLALDPR